MDFVIDGVNFKELPAEKYWSFPKSYKGDPKVDTKNFIFSGDYIGARKMDGAYYRFIKDMNGNMRLQGRSKSVSGEYLDKINWVPQLHDFFNALPNGTCLLGEIYFPNNEGSSNVTTIMGCLEQKARDRQEKGEKLHYYVFDVWAFDGKSMLKTEIGDRINKINLMWADYPHEYVEYARYWDCEDLWNNLGAILKAGGEGIVMTKKGTCPEPGKRPARKTLKVKKEINQTIDCIFTGVGTPPTRSYEGKEIETWKYWENVRTGAKMEGEFYKEYTEGAPIEPVTKPYFHGWVSSLEIGLVKGNKVVPIGFISGLTDEVKANHEKYKGLPIEVTCMEITQNQNGGFGLRHAKLVRFRPDLAITDCTWCKVFGDENQ